MKTLAIYFALLFISSSSIAQTLAVTLEGDTIEVYENGTWKPVQRKVVEAGIVGNVETEVEVDEFTNSKKVTTQYWARFGKDKLKNVLSGYVIKIDDNYVVRVRSTGDLGCISSHSSKMVVKLSNGDLVEMAQIGDTDCGDSPLGMYILASRDATTGSDDIFLAEQAENLQKLMQYDWEAIRLHGSKYYSDFTPNPTSKITQPEQFFRQHLSALVNE